VRLLRLAGIAAHFYDAFRDANDSFQGTQWFHNVAEGFGARCAILYHAACFLSDGARGLRVPQGDRGRDAITDRVDSAFGLARAKRAAFPIEQPMK